MGFHFRRLVEKEKYREAIEYKNKEIEKTLVYVTKFLKHEKGLGTILGHLRRLVKVTENLGKYLHLYAEYEVNNVVERERTRDQIIRSMYVTCSEIINESHKLHSIVHSHGFRKRLSIVADRADDIQDTLKRMLKVKEKNFDKYKHLVPSIIKKRGMKDYEAIAEQEKEIMNVELKSFVKKEDNKRELINV